MYLMQGRVAIAAPIGALMPINSLNRTLRIRQPISLNFSTVLSTSPLRLATFSRDRNIFHELSRAAGPLRQPRKAVPH